MSSFSENIIIFGGGRWTRVIIKVLSEIIKSDCYIYIHTKNPLTYKKIVRENIKIGNNVFVGSHCVILGGAEIGNNSVIAAGTVVRKIKIPPYSLAIGNPAKIKKNYYKKR